MPPHHNITLNQFKLVTHVIFDLDGTIFNSEQIFAEFFTKLASKHGNIKYIFDETIQRKIIGNVSHRFFEILIDELQLPYTKKELAEQSEKELECAFKNVKLHCGAETLINHLHKNQVPLGIATNASQKEVDIMFTNYQDLRKKFDVIVTSSDPDVKNNKPDPDCYLVAAQRFPRQPSTERCLVFEDSVLGLSAALAAHMQVVLVPSFPMPFKIWKNATIKIDNLNEAPLTLFGLPAMVCCRKTS